MKNTPLFLLVAASLVSAAVFASVFVYYPVSVTATPTAPPVIFAEGSNAGGKDLYGTNTIGVTVSQASTSLSITVHPTYQTTYYKNITLIKNLDSNAYYIAFRVNTAATDTNLTSAWLIIKGSSSGDIKIDLLSTYTSNPIPISGGSQYTVDLNITYTAGASSTYDSAPGSGFIASLQLIYSPQNNESAP
ncbi:MAG: hypothetical protein ACP5GN_03370 [Fervidicoccaceae archaeon]